MQALALPSIRRKCLALEPVREQQFLKRHHANLAGTLRDDTKEQLGVQEDQP